MLKSAINSFYSPRSIPYVSLRIVIFLLQRSFLCEWRMKGSTILKLERNENLIHMYEYVQHSLTYFRLLLSRHGNLIDSCLYKLNTAALFSTGNAGVVF
jgi:hypothetical protein